MRFTALQNCRSPVWNLHPVTLLAPRVQRWLLDLINVLEICLEAFAATKFNKIFLGRQPCQGVKISQRFRDLPSPHHQGASDD
jgi:hypothetical protein